MRACPVISSRGRIVKSPRGRKCAVVVVLGAVNAARKIVVLRNGVPLVVETLHNGKHAERAVMSLCSQLLFNRLLCCENGFSASAVLSVQRTGANFVARRIALLCIFPPLVFHATSLAPGLRAVSSLLGRLCEPGWLKTLARRENSPFLPCLDRSCFGPLGGCKYTIF